MMGVNTCAYYTWYNAPKHGDKKQQAQLLSDKVCQIFSDNKHCFGSRQLSDRLKKQGITGGRY
ncbi:MAG: hypothetical protein ACXWTK_07670 [Methylobacter sp.]